MQDGTRMLKACLVFTSGVGYNFDQESPLFPKRESFLVFHSPFGCKPELEGLRGFILLQELPGFTVAYNMELVLRCRYEPLGRFLSPGILQTGNKQQTLEAKYGQITFAYTLIYLWTLAALKLGQLCFYFKAFKAQLKLWIYITSVIIVAWGIICTFVFIFLCDPVEQQWTIDRIGHCRD